MSLDRALGAETSRDGFTTASGCNRSNSSATAAAAAAAAASREQHSWHLSQMPYIPWDWSVKSSVRFSLAQPFNVLQEGQAGGLECLCQAVTAAGAGAAGGRAIGSSYQVGVGWKGVQRAGASRRASAAGRGVHRHTNTQRGQHTRRAAGASTHTLRDDARCLLCVLSLVPICRSGFSRRSCSGSTRQRPCLQHCSQRRPAAARAQWRQRLVRRLQGETGAGLMRLRCCCVSGLSSGERRCGGRTLRSGMGTARWCICAARSVLGAWAV